MASGQNTTKFLLLSIVVLCPSSVSASPFSISKRSYGNATSAVRGQIDALFDQLELAVNTHLPATDATGYLRSVSNAGVMAGKGIGLDYANKFDVFLLGLNAGMGADMGPSPVGDLVGGDLAGHQVPGVGVVPGFVIGLNMGILPIRNIGATQMHKLNLFLNYLALDVDDWADNLHGDASAFGIHVSYHLIDPVTIFPLGMLRWGGILVATGYEYNHLDIAYRLPLNESLTQTVGGADATGTFNGTATVGAKIDTHSIPIEISTNFQVLYATTFFGGLGYDLNSGSTESIANLAGDVRLTGAGVPGGARGLAHLDLGQTGGPSDRFFRGFLGVQFNLWIMKITAQVQKEFSRDLWGANAGLRIVW